MSLGRILGLLALSTILFLSVSMQSLYGQDGDITLQLQLSDPVSQAQVLSLSTLGVDRRGQGQKLGTLLIQNNTSELQEDLYFFVKVENTSNVLARLNQEQGQPFSLDPGQVVRTNNNSLQEGVPGIRNPTFSGGLTGPGEQFVNDLEGTSRLPSDQFTLTVEIYQNGNRGRGTKVASASATVGTNSVSKVRDIYINRPGGEVGSGFDATINTQRPIFDWAGETGLDYRLVVVKREGTESPETLIEAAEDTGPIIVDNVNRDNTLLEHEMADVRLSSNSFQYPASSVKQLEPGETYLWRVNALLTTADGEQQVASEIWQFSISESGEEQSPELSKETIQTLRNVVDDEQLSFLQGEDMEPVSIVIEGQEYSGAAMRQQLRQFLERAQGGEITITNTED